MDNKEKVKNEITSSIIPKPSYVLIQCAMFFLKYGLEYDLPNWVVWFPTIALGVFLTIMLIILLFVIVVGALTD